MVRRGVYSGPLNLNYVAIGGGSAGLHPADMLEFARRTPDGAVLTLETLNRHIYPMNTMAIALGMHVRVGIEDTLFGPHGERMTSVQQIEMMVRRRASCAAKWPAAPRRAASIGIGESWGDADDSLARLGMPPNRAPGQRGVPVRLAA